MTARPRARDAGVPFDGRTGPWNAITDVAGVRVGHRTRIEDPPGDPSGEHRIRTGVTAVFPRPDEFGAPISAGFFRLNGNGEFTGTHWIRESGQLEGPVVLTNTFAIGVAHAAIVEYWMRRHDRSAAHPWTLPVVGETWDGRLNDIERLPVTRDDVWAALETAKAGPVAEGNVGGGTGMVCHGFKGGIGTSSREIAREEGGFRVGVLVQANHGRRSQLRIAGVPVGEELAGTDGAESGSILGVIATDAPLSALQLERLATRAALGIARVGAIGANSSGDMFLAFSTTTPPIGESGARGVAQERIDPLFEAAIGATEESVVNALFAAETMTGVGGHRVDALPLDRVLGILRHHRRGSTDPPRSTRG